MTPCTAVLDAGYVDETCPCQLEAGHTGRHYSEAWDPDGLTWGDPLGRDRYTGAATPAQHTAGARWAAHRAHTAPRTEQDRLDDFDRAEARDEAERYRNR